MKPENDGKIAFQSLAVDSAAVCHLNKHWQMWVTNFGKYPTVEIGNPTQKSIRKCRIPILRNASQQKTGNPTEKGSDKYRLPNIEKYLTAKTGNPTEKWTSDRDMRL